MSSSPTKSEYRRGLPSASGADSVSKGRNERMYANALARSGGSYVEARRPEDERAFAMAGGDVAPPKPPSELFMDCIIPDGEGRPRRYERRVPVGLASTETRALAASSASSAGSEAADSETSGAGTSSGAADAYASARRLPIPKNMLAA